jgi:hypothetical protein
MCSFATYCENTFRSTGKSRKKNIWANDPDTGMKTWRHIAYSCFTIFCSGCVHFRIAGVILLPLLYIMLVLKYEG